MAATKLTLYMDEDLIAQAKDYAKRGGESLSQVVTRLFKALTVLDEAEYKPSKKALSLTGILPPDTDFEKEYADYLEEKYL